MSPFLSIYIKNEGISFFHLQFFGEWGTSLSVWLIADFPLAQGHDTVCHITFLASSSSSQKPSLPTRFPKMGGKHRNLSLIPLPTGTVILGNRWPWTTAVCVFSSRGVSTPCHEGGCGPCLFDSPCYSQGWTPPGAVLVAQEGFSWMKSEWPGGMTYYCFLPQVSCKAQWTPQSSPMATRIILHTDAAKALWACLGRTFHSGCAHTKTTAAEGRGPKSRLSKPSFQKSGWWDPRV